MRSDFTECNNSGGFSEKLAELKKTVVPTAKKMSFALIVAILGYFGIYRCPLKLLFGTDCPGCGMMTAFFAALRLDFAAAFHYHPLFWLLGLETAYVIFSAPIRVLIGRHDRAETAVGAASLILLLIVWIVRRFI